MSLSRQHDQAPAFAQKALSRLVGERYTVRKKTITFTGNQYHIYGPAQQLRFFVKQKLLTFKESITIYRDESMSRPLLKIQARRAISFNATYDISTPCGEPIGALKHDSLRNIVRDRWLILSPNGTQIGLIEEDSTRLAIYRRMLFFLLPQRYDVSIHGKKVAVFRQHFNLFVSKIDIDFSLDPQGLLDRRLGIAAVVLLLAIQHSRG